MKKITAPETLSNTVDDRVTEILEYLDFSKLSDEEKQKFADDFMRLSGKGYFYVFRTLGFKSHMDCMIIDSESKEEFILSFRKKDFNHPIYPQPAPQMSKGIDFARWLAENTEVIKEEKITLYRYNDHRHDGWGNYTLDDIYSVFNEFDDEQSPANDGWIEIKEGEVIKEKEIMFLVDGKTWPHPTVASYWEIPGDSGWHNQQGEFLYGVTRYREIPK